MKQVFDWMRNKTRAELEHAENEVRTGKGILIKEPFTPYKKFISIINEAEAKWNEDVCEALEKQIPKKPDIWGDGYADGQLVYDSYDCPNCGKTYELDYDDYDYCPKCGQKFDWSEVEK